MDSRQEHVLTAPLDRKWVEIRETDKPRWFKKARAVLDVPEDNIGELLIFLSFKAIANHCSAPHLHIKCAARRDFNHKDRYWIISPNMEHIPEQPSCSLSPLIKSDGTMGLYEWTEHPRCHMPHRPHECMIKVTVFTAVQKNLLLRRLERTDLIWDHARHIGRIRPSLIQLIQEEFKRVTGLVQERWPLSLSAHTLPQDSKTHALLARCHLIDRAMVWKNAVTFWRQWQRCTRDLLAWCDWTDLLRDMDRQCQPKTCVDTTRRGAFTADPDVVKLLTCLGIPVWYITILDGYAPPNRIKPIQPWVSNPVLASEDAPPDWATPDLFLRVYDPYGPFILPNSINAIRPIQPILRPPMEYNTDFMAVESHASDRDELDNFNEVYNCETTIRSEFLC